MLVEATIQKIKGIKEWFYTTKYFKVGVYNDVPDNILAAKKAYWAGIIDQASNYIHDIGLPRMRAYIIIRSSKFDPNFITGGETAGQAHRNYIEVLDKYISVEVLVHEWAHHVIYNSPKESVRQLTRDFNDLISNAIVLPTDVIHWGLIDEILTEKIDSIGNFYDESYFSVWKIGYLLEYSESSQLDYKRIWKALQQMQINDVVLKRDVLLSNYASYNLKMSAGQKVDIMFGFNEFFIEYIHHHSRYSRAINNVSNIHDYVELPVERVLKELQDDVSADITEYGSVNGVAKHAADRIVLRAYIQAVRAVCDYVNNQYGYKLLYEENVLKATEKWVKEFVNKQSMEKHLIEIEEFINFPVSDGNLKVYMDNLSYYIAHYLYDELDKCVNKISYTSKFSKPDTNKLRDAINRSIGYHNSYGIANHHEFFATALESFDKLPAKFKKIIIKNIF